MSSISGERNFCMAASFSLYNRSESIFTGSSPTFCWAVPGVSACPGEAGVFSELCGEGAPRVVALPAGDIIGMLCTEAGLLMLLWKFEGEW